MCFIANVSLVRVICFYLENLVLPDIAWHLHFMIFLSSVATFQNRPYYLSRNPIIMQFIICNLINFFIIVMRQL
jgi:hypothetical protein